MNVSAGESISDRVLAEALNVPLYAPSWYIPEYRVLDTQDWRIITCPFHLERGYSSGLWGISSLPLLVRRSERDEEEWETWMSLTPHEIESQELGCQYGTGHSVVMGLGMGWVAMNMALNPAIEQVTVIERDPQVIALLEQSGAMEGLTEEARRKIHIVQADALQWIPDEKVDFLYADIWRCLDEPQTLDHVQQMQRNVKADTVYFWGQEIKIYRLLGEKLDAFRQDSVQQLGAALMEITGLPLLIPDTSEYIDMIETVMSNRRAKGIEKN